jgi:hypothetical protein
MNVRLGSPLPQTWDSAAGWIAAVQRHGFRAAYWPLGDDADVETVDAGEPQRTFYSLEPMPWSRTDSPDSYLELIGTVERRQFGVHLDPVNLFNSPAKYYDDAGLLRDCFAKLGPQIKSCHAKDVTLANELTVHLAEVRRHVGVDAQRPRAARVVVVGVHEHVVDRAGRAGEQGHAPEEARQPPHVLILEVGPRRPLVDADRQHRRHGAPVLRDPEAHAVVARRVPVGDVRRVDGNWVDDIGVGGAP